MKTFFLIICRFSLTAVLLYRSDVPKLPLTTYIFKILGMWFCYETIKNKTYIFGEVYFYESTIRNNDPKYYIKRPQNVLSMIFLVYLLCRLDSVVPKLLLKCDIFIRIV